MISDDIEEHLGQLYTDPTTARQSQFIRKNLIVINPKSICEIMTMIETNFSISKITQLLENLNSIIEKIPQNSVAIFHSSVNYDQKQHGDNIVDFLIKIYFKLVETKSTQLLNKISELVSNFLSFNNATPQNLTKIYRRNTVQFYSGDVSSFLCYYSIKLLQEIFSKYTPLTQEPQNFFYFSYNRSGIKVNPTKSLQWPFTNGICLCFWFYLEEYDGVAEKDHPQKLFTIHCSSNGGGGIEAYFIGFNLYYRVLPMNYTHPTAGSNGVLIGEYKPKTWYFLGLEHERAKTFGRAFLNIYINQKFYKNYNIEYPKINGDLEITNMSFGDQLFGRISTIMIFNSTIGKKLGDFYSFFNFGIQNSSGLKNLKIILEALMSKLYMLYIPTRSSNSHCFDLINNNDGIFLENTGVTWKDTLKMKMTFSGGMSSILPFFYLLRFCDNKEFPNLLNELLRLVIILLRNKAENQSEALKINLFQIIGQHLCELNCNFFNHETLEAFAELKHIIHEQKLIDQLFLDIIWNLDILEHCVDYTTINEHFKYVRSFYLEKPQHYLTLYGISDILSIALEKFDIKNLTCCETHSLALGLNIEKSMNASSKTNWKIEEIIKPILSIVEAIIINGGDNITNDFIQILHTFNSKSSPCFLIHLFQLLKTILIDRADENSAGIKIMLKLLTEHNFILTLVYLISTSPCLDIKAMSVKFINFLINQKIPSINEKELSIYISFIMWNLNLPKKSLLIPNSIDTPNQSEQKPPQNLSPKMFGRKSCKPPMMMMEENPLSSAEHQGKNRSRSVDSGPTTKFYQKDLINEKKKNFFEGQTPKKEGEEEENENEMKQRENNQDLEMSSENSENNEETKNKSPEKKDDDFPFEKKMMIQVEDEKEEVKTDDLLQQDLINLGTQFLNNDYENIPQAPSMSNKRKPKTMDFGFSSNPPPLQSKKSLESQAKGPAKFEETIKGKIEINEKEPTEIKQEEIILKPNLKSKKSAGKFNLKLKEDIIEESLETSEKPIPAIDRKSPKISINVVPQIKIISEDNLKIEENADKNKPKVSSLKPTTKKPFGGKKSFAPVLMIDTDQINEIYSYGGEKGKRVQINLDELSEEYREIAELAVLCVRYMRGELKNDDYFANKMPMIKKFDAPQSVRGLKTVSFPEKAPTKSKFNKELTVIKENSISFDTDINLSNSIDINKNSIEETSNSFKFEKRDSIPENKFVAFSTEYEVETLDCQPLYNALMEWVLRKTPSNLESQLTIDDTDKVDSPVLLQLVMAFYRNCSHELKPKILQDLIMLIKWNQSNCNALLDSPDFSFWLVEVLLHQQILFLDADVKSSTTILDFGTKIFGILSKHAINTYANGYEKILAIVKHLQTISIDKKGSEEEKKASVAAKFLLRHLYSNILDSLIDLSKASRPNMSSIFWKNLMNLVFLTQEIVFFTYDQYEFEVLREIPFMVISCNVIKNENEIPQNFKKIYAENKWLDYKIVESLFKVLDSLWPEIFPQKTKSNMDEIQKKIVNLLDYINASEYAKDLEIFLYEAYATHETFKKRGSVIKIVNILLTIYLELSFHFDKINNTMIWLDKYSKILKYFLMVCENVRDSTLGNAQQSNIISNILFPFHWFFTFYEKFRENEKIASLIMTQIDDLVMFKIYLLDQMNNKIGGFQNYNELKSNMFANLYMSNQIPISNLFTFEIFTNYLLNANNEKILPYSLYELSKKTKFGDLENILFTKDWKFAFTKQKMVLDVLQANFDEDFKKYFPFLFRTLETQYDTGRKFMKISEKNKETLRTKYENDIYEQNLNVLEEEDLKKQNDIFLSEKKYRFNKYMWEKIWKRARTHHGTWMHPDFSTQNDKKFDPKDFDFDKIKPNDFFYYKTWKYELKNRSRPFLNLKLKEPQMVSKDKEELRNKKHSLLNNYQTILHMSPFKSLNLEMKPQTSGNQNLNIMLTDENSISNSGLLQPNSSRTKSKFISDVRKNISNSIKAIQSKALPFLNYYKTDDIYLQKRCQWIKTLSIVAGILTVTSEKLIFHFDSLEQKESHLAFLCYKLAENRPFFKEWSLENVREIQRRRYILRKTALEIFLVDGTSILFNFPDSDNEEVSQKLIRLRKTKCVNLQYNKTLDAKKLIDKSGVLKKWLNYEISNFDYLMLLNGLSGRSYKDVTQYHVFPWILTNYVLEKIDQENSAIFRDFSKTMGAMGNSERIKIFMERYEHNDPYAEVPSFHFGSHYSSPAIIFHYLIRLHPYTLGAKELQNGKFDLPDRLFFDLEDSYRCATEEISDVRELIPEFFYMPELFLNLEKHDFGVQQSGHRVHNVILPKWAHGNPYFFITIYRLCLESDYVSRNLHNWIDLIFGYKQKGKEAEKNLNTFYYMTYEDSIEIDKIDPSLKISTEAQIIHFGQTPSQLFLKGHPGRPNKENLIQGKWISDPSANLKIYKPSNKKKNEDLSKSPKLKRKNFFMLEGKAIIKMRFISESKIAALRKNGTLSTFRWWNQALNSSPPPPNMALIPFSCATDKEKQLNFEKLKSI